jgi:Protein of unknown function (DUF3485)
MLRFMPPLIAAVLLVATGIVHGYWTDRWAAAVEPQQAADRLPGIPMKVGDWDGRIPEKQAPAVPGVVGTVQRIYTNRVTGATVTLAIVCGRPGPVSIHTPESCYAASGYTLAKPFSVAVNPGVDFWTADAVRVKATEESRLRIFWGWSGGQGWSAPDEARTTFARYPVLHKLYVLRELNSLSEPIKDDPGLAFLRAALPELDATLFAPGL